MGNKELLDAGWSIHGGVYYSFEDSESMSMRDALSLHRSYTRIKDTP